jgi:hypothetical protein
VPRFSARNMPRIAYIVGIMLGWQPLLPGWTTASRG